MCVYAAELICSTGVSGFQAFKPVFCIQLFRVRLSYERGRAYAAMSKVIMGNGGFTVALLNLRCFSVVEGKSNDQRLCHGDTDDSRESGNSYAINSSHTVQNQFTITIHKVR